MLEDFEVCVREMVSRIEKTPYRGSEKARRRPIRQDGTDPPSPDQQACEALERPSRNKAH